MGDINSLVLQIAVYALPVVLAITLHEAAHGYVARHFGDKTAWMLGRISLNPLRHVDPIGTVLVPLLTMMGGMVFGWAKPVPVVYGNLRRPKQDMLWVALAGPASNLVQAVVWAIMAKFAVFMVTIPFVSAWLLPTALAGVKVNIVLAVLNMMPILPLDGGRILTSLLPNPMAYQFSRLEPYGLIILVVLLFTDVLGKVLWPLVGLFIGVFSVVFGI